jgi:tetratricopeptide (TPR) repeat protein
LTYLGMVAYNQEDYASARACYEKGLAIRRELGDKLGITHSLNALGYIACCQGDYTVARTLCEESLTTGRELGDRSAIALALCTLGAVASGQGDYVVARAHSEESLAIAWELRDRRVIVACLQELAKIACAQGQPKRAACIYGAAEALCEATGVPLSPVQRALYERAVAAVRATLDEDVLAEAWAEGRAMSLEEAISYAGAKHARGPE